ncbi:hypothetical protein [Denitromonas iodatirespirans]|uniref:Uncharacterized protein n=1 Tax=Denitromonas iodatirespirans TaxID=2795389 RepID=A0A944HDC3_DENI1|nr:hypothetical protein [Denitromonas iodatirespirans]MBT0963577.1 hypothetical protein [Denitromonas iodatirespirans]
MIQALTPQLLAVALLLIIALASALSLLIALGVRWRYRRRVLQAMAESVGGFPAGADETAAPVRPEATAPDDATACCQHVLHRPWQALGRDALAGLAAVAVMTTALWLAFPMLRAPAQVALFAWGYAWPLVLAAAIHCPAGWRGGAALLAAYFLPLLIYTGVALLAPPNPEDVAALRVAITPVAVLYAWSVANAVPTLVLLIFLSRRLRAVGPLLLALMTVATAGCVMVWLWLFSERGSALAVALAVASGLSVAVIVPALLLLALLAFMALGAWLLGRVRRAYLAKTLNDRSLARDALWLYFAGIYAMYYAPAGLAWAPVPLLAFGAYKLAGRCLTRRCPAPPAGRGLTYLRVFSLGRHSDRLFDALARHWRHVGSLQLITGPDLALSTLQPHQLLDFLSGRLARHFVADTASLGERLAARDRLPDRDGLYRINNFFCHADSWQRVLAALVRDGDRVLMDLRSFSAAHAGCVHELTYLAHHVPLSRCVLLVDERTDERFLQRTLADAWHTLPADSPNRAGSPAAVALHRYDGGPAALPALLRQLCRAA